MSPGMFFLFPSDRLTRGLLLMSSVLYIISQLNNSHQLIQEGFSFMEIWWDFPKMVSTQMRKQESFGNPTRWNAEGLNIF